MAKKTTTVEWEFCIGLYNTQSNVACIQCFLSTGFGNQTPVERGNPECYYTKKG